MKEQSDGCRPPNEPHQLRWSRIGSDQYCRLTGRAEPLRYGCHSSSMDIKSSGSHIVTIVSVLETATLVEKFIAIRLAVWQSQRVSRTVHLQ